MARTVIAATTSAVTTKTQVQFNNVPVTIFATNLGASEEIPIYYSFDQGTNWEELYLDGSQVVLTNTNKAATVYGPMFLSVTKPTTVAAVGVYTSDFDSI